MAMKRPEESEKFAFVKCMSEVFESEEELIGRLKAEGLMDEFQRLSEVLQKDFVEFCTGQKGLNVRSDPMFKRVFDPSICPERLEEFLSLCLKRSLKILKIMPNESHRLTEESSLLIMDILVQLEDGELVNVEIQRVGYLFPGERVSCYLSDLLMRQYAQIKEQRRQEDKQFSYKDIKKVYCIVLIENSTRVFKNLPNQYLHRGRMMFDTGLNLDMPQECLLIPLDIFLKNHQNIDNRLDAWLYFIASEKLTDIRKVIEAYPEFEELYEEIFQFRYHVKELIGMYSKELSILDANTVKYMVEQQQEELERQAEALKRKDEELEDKARELEALRQVIKELKAKQG
ncbi:MAG: PD-(D/E)XK nuclease family transposase [Lachnospiraceae bacterium]|nr:PD-(D/E)XK nuclease family transposase [Lachnospiraceae bacterium]